MRNDNGVNIDDGAIFGNNEHPAGRVKSILTPIGRRRCRRAAPRRRMAARRAAAWRGERRAGGVSAYRQCGSNI